MNHISLNRIYINNFGLIKEVTIDLPRAELVFITGEHVTRDHLQKVSIGTGKSTLINAIYFALSGDIAKKINISEIIGPFDKVTKTEALLSSQDHQYKIERERNAKQGKVNFYIDGVLINALNAKGTDQLIQEHLQTNWDIFKHSNYIPPIDDAQASFLYASDGERKDIIGSLYSKGFFDVVLEKFKERLKESNQDLRELELRASGLQGEIKSSNYNLNVIKEKIANIEIQNFKLDISGTKTQLDTIASDMEGISVKLKTYHEDETELSTKLVHSKRLLDQAMTARGVSDKALAVLQSTNEGLLGELRRAKTLLKEQGDCPTCLSPLTPRSSANLKLYCNNLISSYKEKELTFKQQEEEAEKLKKKYLDLFAKSNKLSYKNIELQKEIRGNLNRLLELKTEKNKLEAVLQAHVLDTKSLEEHRDQLKEKIKALYLENMELEGGRKTREQQVRRLELWERAYAHELRSMAFESIIDQFTLSVSNKMLRIYGDNLAVKFDTKTEKADKLQEKLSILIKDKDVDKWKSSVFASGGQRRIISLAIALAIMEKSKPGLALFMLDEALEKVDPVVTKSAIDCLRELSREATVLFVTHNIEVPLGERKFTAIRKDGVITIEV